MPERIDAYGLTMPSDEAARASLLRVLGPEASRAAWTSACAAAGVAGDRTLNLDELRLVADHLAGQGGIVGVLGVALRVRIETWDALSKKVGSV